MTKSRAARHIALVFASAAAMLWKGKQLTSERQRRDTWHGFPSFLILFGEKSLRRPTQVAGINCAIRGIQHHASWMEETSGFCTIVHLRTWGDKSSPHNPTCIDGSVNSRNHLCRSVGSAKPSSDLFDALRPAVVWGKGDVCIRFLSWFSKQILS